MSSSHVTDSYKRIQLNWRLPLIPWQVVKGLLEASAETKRRNRFGEDQMGEAVDDLNRSIVQVLQRQVYSDFVALNPPKLWVDKNPGCCFKNTTAIAFAFLPGAGLVWLFDDFRPSPSVRTPWCWQKAKATGRPGKLLAVHSCSSLLPFAVAFILICYSI